MRPEHWIYTIPLRLRSLFRWTQADQELDDELRDHLERRTEEYIAQGMRQEEAHRRARLDLEGIEQTKEKCRDARRVNWIQDFVQDLRYGLRILRKSPGFTTVAVLTLALGIGANTAIFTVMNALMFKSLPVLEPERLLQIRQDDKNADFTYALWQQIRAQQDVFSSVFAYTGAAFDLSTGGEKDVARAFEVSGDYFETLGISAVLGRTITEQDD